VANISILVSQCLNGMCNMYVCTSLVTVVCGTICFSYCYISLHDSQILSICSLPSGLEIDS